MEGRKCDTVVESRLQGCRWVTANEASRVLELGNYGGPKKCDTVAESRLQGCRRVTANEASRVLGLGNYGGPKV